MGPGARSRLPAAALPPLRARGSGHPQRSASPGRGCPGLPGAAGTETGRAQRGVPPPARPSPPPRGRGSRRDGMGRDGTGRRGADPRRPARRRRAPPRRQPRLSAAPPPAGAGTY